MSQARTIDDDPLSEPNAPLTCAILWIRNMGKPRPEICRDFNLVQLCHIIRKDANDLPIPMELLVQALNTLGYTVDFSGGASPHFWYTNIASYVQKGMQARLEFKQRGPSSLWPNKRKNGRKHHHYALSVAQRDDLKRRRTQH